MSVENSFDDLCTAIAAHRLDVLRIAGLLGIASDEMHEEVDDGAGPKIERWAELTAECARSLAIQVVELSRRTDDLLEQTQPMLHSDLADPESDP